MDNEKSKDRQKFILGFALLVWVRAVMFDLMFFTAYLTPLKKVIVNIDKFGEADLEFILIMILFILTIPWIIMVCKSIRKL